MKRPPQIAREQRKAGRPLRTCQHPNTNQELNGRTPNLTTRRKRSFLPDALMTPAEGEQIVLLLSIETRSAPAVPNRLSHFLPSFYPGTWAKRATARKKCQRRSRQHTNIRPVLAHPQNATLLILPFAFCRLHFKKAPSFHDFRDFSLSPLGTISPSEVAEIC
jgi:hypothetical protein